MDLITPMGFCSQMKLVVVTMKILHSSGSCLPQCLLKITWHWTSCHIPLKCVSLCSTWSMGSSYHSPSTPISNLFPIQGVGPFLNIQSKPMLIILLSLDVLLNFSLCYCLYIMSYIVFCLLLNIICSRVRKCKLLLTVIMQKPTACGKTRTLEDKLTLDLSLGFLLPKM